MVQTVQDNQNNMNDEDVNSLTQVAMQAIAGEFVRTAMCV